MSRIKSGNTAPEKILRIYLHRSGFRYRIHCRLHGKPDIVFTGQKVAVFIHGCFWHRHGCKNSVIPKTNTNFWTEKLSKNIQRDKEVGIKLTAEGWKVKVIWECELEDNFKKTVNSLVNFLHKSGLKPRNVKNDLLTLRTRAGRN